MMELHDFWANRMGAGGAGGFLCAGCFLFSWLHSSVLI
jgi:hypothetical protein